MNVAPTLMRSADSPPTRAVRVQCRPSSDDVYAAIIDVSPAGSPMHASMRTRPLNARLGFSVNPRHGAGSYDHDSPPLCVTANCHGPRRLVFLVLTVSATNASVRDVTSRSEPPNPPRRAAVGLH